MKKSSPYLLALCITAIAIISGCQKNSSTNSAPAKNDDQASRAKTNEAALVTSTPIQIYGVWHAGNDACTWATVRTVTEFDSKNHWLIDRGNGQPSVNIVILSFVNPLKLMNSTTDAGNLNGVPRGMTADIVNYFKSRNIRVMLSIGGITFTDDLNKGLFTQSTQKGFRGPASFQKI